MLDLQAEQEQALLATIRSLPKERFRQVVDFVNFLEQQEDQEFVRAGARLSAIALEKVWDNPDDAAYDNL